LSKLASLSLERTLSSSSQLMALVKIRDVAESMGHHSRVHISCGYQKDSQAGCAIHPRQHRPLNITYVLQDAQMYGIPVVDDPSSIQICADKNKHVHASHEKECVHAQTKFLKKKELTQSRAQQLFEELGTPLVLKEPSTSFSVRVEKASSVDELLKIAKRFFKALGLDRIRSTSRAGSTGEWALSMESCSTPAGTSSPPRPSRSRLPSMAILSIAMWRACLPIRCRQRLSISEKRLAKPSVKGL